MSDILSFIWPLIPVFVALVARVEKKAGPFSILAASAYLIAICISIVNPGENIYHIDFLKKVLDATIYYNVEIFALGIILFAFVFYDKISESKSSPWVALSIFILQFIFIVRDVWAVATILQLLVLVSFLFIKTKTIKNKSMILISLTMSIYFYASILWYLKETTASTMLFLGIILAMTYHFIISTSIKATKVNIAYVYSIVLFACLLATRKYIKSYEVNRDMLLITNLIISMLVLVVKRRLIKYEMIIVLLVSALIIDFNVTSLFLAVPILAVSEMFVLPRGSRSLTNLISRGFPIGVVFVICLLIIKKLFVYNPWMGGGFLVLYMISCYKKESVVVEDLGDNMEKQQKIMNKLMNTILNIFSYIIMAKMVWN